jgi:hypothetical protein
VNITEFELTIFYHLQGLDSETTIVNSEAVIENVPESVAVQEVDIIKPQVKRKLEMTTAQPVPSPVKKPKFTRRVRYFLMH